MQFRYMLAPLILVLIASLVAALLIAGLVLLERTMGLHTLYFAGDLDLVFLSIAVLPLLIVCCKWLIVRRSIPTQPSLSVHLTQSWMLYVVGSLALASVMRNSQGAGGLLYGLTSTFAAVMVYTIVVHAAVSFSFRRRT